MSRRLMFFLTGGALFLSFVFFSYLVHEDLFTQLDFNTTVRLQDQISRSWDREFSWFSEIGSFEVSLVFLVIIFAIWRKWIAGLASFVLFCGFHLIELFGKFFVAHPPPPEFMLRTEQLVTLPQFHVRAEYSYPSGHSGRAIFLSIILGVLVLQSKNLSPFIKMCLLLGLVGYNSVMLVSRIYLGEHWTTDVVGGALLGAALGLMSTTALQKN